MLEIDIDGVTVRIVFKHVTHGKDRRTECQLLAMNYRDDTNDPYLLGEGVARCNPSDDYRKEIGRRLALTRALENAGFSKESRTKVWECYWWRDRDTQLEFVATYVPDMENYSAADAVSMAEALDEQAAQLLRDSVVPA